MNKLEQILNNTLMPAALAVGMYAMPANAATMSVIGPGVGDGYTLITTGDYISNGNDALGNPILEKRWRYDITNTSTVGDVNNMIEWHIDAGSNDGILGIAKTYSGTGTITLDLSEATAGFTGLLPPPSGGLNNKVSIVLYTPTETISAPGLATATARGEGYNVPFNSVAIQVPSNIPEPSSGLLLLLGAGALAYQRKR